MCRSDGPPRGKYWRAWAWTPCGTLIGSEAVPALQRIRREGPGRMRSRGIDVLGLTDPRPATFALGADVVDSDAHDRAQGDGSAWLVVENGAVIRRCSATGEACDELLALGEPLPLERVRRAELGLPPEGEEASEDDADEWGHAAFGLAPEIAGDLSVDPLGLGPDTPVSGTGLIALTPYGVEHGVPKGAYRI